MKNKKTILLLIFLSFCAALLVGRHILLKPQEKIQVVSTTPYLGQNNIPLNQTITLKFKQDISEEEFAIFTFPDFRYQLKKEEKSLVIKPQKNLTPNTKYNIEIKNKKNNFYFTFFFFTQTESDSFPSVPTSESGRGKGDPEAEKLMTQEVLENYPLFKETPHREKNWTADYLEPKKLIVTYQKGTDISFIQEEVFSWMEKEGVDPDTHTFIWKEKD